MIGLRLRSQSLKLARMFFSLGRHGRKQLSNGGPRTLQSRHGLVHCLQSMCKQLVSSCQRVWRPSRQEGNASVCSLCSSHLDKLHIFGTATGCGKRGSLLSSVVAACPKHLKLRSNECRWRRLTALHKGLKPLKATCHSLPRSHTHRGRECDLPVKWHYRWAQA